MRTRMARCYQPAAEAAIRGVVRIALTGSPPVSWLAQLANGKLDVADDGAAEPAATIESDRGVYALVQTARRPAGVFEAQGRWRVTGDRELAGHLANAFKGV
ncbi:MAG: SCP2 sterol-binding domain-containing protein [Chloroflexi bacterium]|nr:SCP2 sterol-binding domain-containing protein [Chloroflexota bacterium]